MEKYFGEKTTMILMLKFFLEWKEHSTHSFNYFLILCATVLTMYFINSHAATDGIRITRPKNNSNINWSTHPKSWPTPPSFLSTHSCILDNSPTFWDNSPNYFFFTYPGTRYMAKYPVFCYLWVLKC